MKLFRVCKLCDWCCLQKVKSHAPPPVAVCPIPPDAKKAAGGKAKPDKV